MLAVSYELRLARGAAAAAGGPELEAILISAIAQIFPKLDLDTDPGSHQRVLAVLAFLRSPA